MGEEKFSVFESVSVIKKIDVSLICFYIFLESILELKRNQVVIIYITYTAFKNYYKSNMV